MGTKAGILAGGSPRRRAAGAVLAGLLSTVLAAWIAGIAGYTTSGALHAVSGEESISVPAVLAIPKDWHVRSWHERHGPGCSYHLVTEMVWMGSRPGMTMDGSSQRIVTIVRVGWPVRAMRWEDGERPGQGAASLVRGGLAVPFVTQRAWDGRLALQPEWPGFVACVAVHALFWWLLFCLVGHIHRWLRIRRGACEHCGYAMEGLGRASACPECGKTSGRGAEPAPESR